MRRLDVTVIGKWEFPAGGTGQGNGVIGLLARGLGCGVVESSEQVSLVARSGWLTRDRGSGSRHHNLETRWSERIKDRATFNSLCLFSACHMYGMHGTKGRGMLTVHCTKRGEYRITYIGERKGCSTREGN